MCFKFNSFEGIVHKYSLYAYTCLVVYSLVELCHHIGMSCRNVLFVSDSFDNIVGIYKKPQLGFSLV